MMEYDDWIKEFGNLDIPEEIRELAKLVLQESPELAESYTTT